MDYLWLRDKLGFDLIFWKISSKNIPVSALNAFDKMKLV